MLYYKLINGTTFVGIATSLDMRRYQHKHRILLVCDESKAQYVQCNDKCYHARWMLPINTNQVVYDTAEVIQISKEEYDILFETIEAGKDIVIEPEQEVIEEEIVTEPDVTIEFVKTSKIAEMNNKCNKTIIAGFDAVLSDGKVYHFSLTTQDQLNLITLSTMLDSGETAIPYHADGELCRFYSAADIKTILETATQFKTYHVSYFNSLKSYILSLDKIESVRAIVYGISIPPEYQSDVLKVLSI